MEAIIKCGRGKLGASLSHGVEITRGKLEAESDGSDTPCYPLGHDAQEGFFDLTNGTIKRISKSQTRGRYPRMISLGSFFSHIPEKKVIFTIAVSKAGNLASVARSRCHSYTSELDCIIICPSRPVFYLRRV